MLLWDVGTQRAIGSPLQIEHGAYVSATFSRDGSHLFAVPHTGRGVRWDVRPESWKRQACLVAGRELTEPEWRDALPTGPPAQMGATRRSSRWRSGRAAAVFADAARFRFDRPRDSDEGRRRA